ncbi:MAG: oxygen-independent coproporphyrinogen III oxidase [Enhydrobacter sp.]|nr:oxygen-independent coproporphyrinogen III oxidase [Enhydrobacter sp.]
MDPALLAAYDRPVPRYTSYPTAAQFTPSVGPAQHADWLRDLNEVSASLYVHVPFCRELCWYCACHTKAMNRPGTLDSYADALLGELEALARAAPGLILQAVQWGGGTPSQLGPARLQTVGRRITELFDRRSDAEISLEIDPRHCDSEIASAAAAIGVTRVSLGVQDFDEGVQAAINRRQSFADTADAVDRLRAAGIGRFNIDLVYGLPCQTLETLAATLDLALKLGPDRFAVFGYAHVPWMKPHQKLIDDADLPDDALRARMSALVAERLVAAGYCRIGLDHYARPGDRLANAAADGSLHRNFQGYVADQAAFVAGIGASAISSLPRGFTQNVADPARYLATVGKDGLATARGIALTRDDRLRGAIIERVMCQNAVDLEALCREHRVDPDAFRASVDPDLDRLERDGLILRADARVTVTETGRPFVRFVCAAFDRHYVAAEGRHSRGL